MSDTDSEPPSPKRTRTKRGLSAKLKSIGCLKSGTSKDGATSVSSISSLYSNKGYGAMSGVIKGVAVVASVSEDPDTKEVEAEVKETFTEEPAVIVDPVFDGDTKHVAAVEGQEEDTDSDDVQIVLRDKSPTPPPDELPPTRRRGKRKGKQLKQAIKNLDHISSMYKNNNDADLEILGDSPQKTPVRDTITIKVRSRSGLHRMDMKKHESFSRVISEMAQQECVDIHEIILFRGDTTLKTYDTPDTINLHIADIIECHIRKASDVNNEEISRDDYDAINLRVQGKKFRTNIAVRRDEPLSRLMAKFADQCGKTMDTLKFIFDDEEIAAIETADDLDLEDDYCIDVVGV